MAPRPKKQAAKRKPANGSNGENDRDDDDLELDEENGNGDGEETGNGDDEPVSNATSYQPPIKPKPDDGGDIDVQIRKDKITITLPRDSDAPETLNRIADLLDGL